MTEFSRRLLLVLPVLATTAALPAADWPRWGRDATGNMIAPEEKNLPAAFDPGKPVAGSEQIDMATTKNVKWVVKLGSQAYGNPTIANGRVFVGTNNEHVRDPQHKGDRGILLALDEKTGEFLWQLVVPKLGAGKVSDWEFLGICSSPTVDGDRLYLVSNRCDALALDVAGMADGNAGPYLDEEKFVLSPKEPPAKIGAKDADVIWRYDMIDELGVFPHNITSSSPLIVGDRIYVTTSNGVDWSHTNVPSPNAPALVVLDKNTGELLGEEASGISQRLYHCNWSSPTYAKGIGKDGLVIFGGGDGFCYAYEPVPVPGPEGFPILKEVWRFDMNPPAYVTDDKGKKIRYAYYEGPSEIIATPVVYKDRVYVAIGQDPEHGQGLGNLVCIDATGQGDVTKSKQVWSYRDIGRSISTASIADGLLYIGEFSGKVHCLDAETGKVQWVFDTGSAIWGSTLVADGKVYIGNEAGDLFILQAGREMKELARINMGAPIYSSPVAANGVLYVGTQTHLYALANQE